MWRRLRFFFGKKYPLHNRFMRLFAEHRKHLTRRDKWVFYGVIWLMFPWIFLSGWLSQQILANKFAVVLMSTTLVFGYMFAVLYPVGLRLQHKFLRAYSENGVFLLCLQCGYDLHGLSANVDTKCPECGRSISTTEEIEELIRS